MKCKSSTTRNALLCLPLISLFGCGSGGSSGDEPEPEAPIVQTEACTEDCETDGENDTTLEPLSYTESTLTTDSPVTVSARQRDIRVFRVESGAEVSVMSSRGEVELILFDELSDIDLDDLYNDDNSLCRSSWRFIEDNCTAVATDDDMYALVDPFYGDTTYTITSTNDCSVENVNRWVYRNMQDYYLYADQVAEIDTDSYTDSNDLVRDLRNEDYSFIGDAATISARFDEGVDFGFGYGWARDDNEQLRLRYVYDDSPFGRAGFKRGDIAVSLGGESFDDIENERFDELIGDDDNPLWVNWEFIDGDTGQTKTATLRMDEYQINTVLNSDVFTSTRTEGRVGYIAFRSFLETSRTELNEAIDNINASNPTDLVLDLRYNGGGRSSVSRRLASQIGGTGLDDQLHSKFEYNSKYSRLNYEEEFFDALPSLDLSRLIVLTSSRTASASERLINSLKPYMEVITIGSTTRGKPYRSAGKRFCGKSLSAMYSRGVNASGVSVTGGITPNCYAADDTSRDFGFKSGSTEGMLRTALDYAFEGICLSQPITKKKPQKPVPPTYEQELIADEL